MQNRIQYPVIDRFHGNGPSPSQGSTTSTSIPPSTRRRMILWNYSNSGGKQKQQLINKRLLHSISFCRILPWPQYSIAIVAIDLLPSPPLPGWLADCLHWASMNGWWSEAAGTCVDAVKEEEVVEETWFCSFMHSFPSPCRCTFRRIYKLAIVNDGTGGDWVCPADILLMQMMGSRRFWTEWWHKLN